MATKMLLMKDLMNDDINVCETEWRRRYWEVREELMKLKEQLSSRHPSVHRMPEYMKPKDLVALGFYSSVHTIYLARRKGRGFPFVKIGGSIFYHKPEVLRVLEEKTHIVTGDKDI
jgi:hypothetical protein